MENPSAEAIFKWHASFLVSEISASNWASVCLRFLPRVVTLMLRVPSLGAIVRPTSAGSPNDALAKSLLVSWRQRKYHRDPWCWISEILNVSRAKPRMQRNVSRRRISTSKKQDSRASDTHHEDYNELTNVVRCFILEWWLKHIFHVISFISEEGGIALQERTSQEF
mgnify:FL=1